MGEFGTYVIMPLILIAVGIAIEKIRLRLKPRAKVVWYSPNPFFLRNPEDDNTIYTQIIHIKNTGKEIASGLEIIHTRKPDRFSIIPPRTHETNANPDGGHVIIINNLAPAECLTIQLLGSMEPPSLPVIRSNSGEAEQRMKLSF